MFEYGYAGMVSIRVGLLVCFSFIVLAPQGQPVTCHPYCTYFFYLDWIFTSPLQEPGPPYTTNEHLVQILER